MRLSIIIAVYNSHEAVNRQIKYFSAMNLPEDIEIILVDDGSEPPLVGPYEWCNLTILYTYDKRAWTQGLARNMGVKAAKGEYILMTDIDHILSKEAIMDSYNFKGDKMIFPRFFGVLLPDGKLSQQEDILVEYGLDINRISSKRGLYASYHGNTFCMRKNLFMELGMYDPKHCTYGHHAASRQGEDSVLNRRFNHWAAKNNGIQEVGSKIYMFPIGRYHINGDLNPKGLFHSLSQELLIQPNKE